MPRTGHTGDGRAAGRARDRRRAPRAAPSHGRARAHGPRGDAHPPGRRGRWLETTPSRRPCADRGHRVRARPTSDTFHTLVNLELCSRALISLRARTRHGWATHLARYHAVGSRQSQRDGPPPTGPIELCGCAGASAHMCARTRTPHAHTCSLKAASHLTCPHMSDPLIPQERDLVHTSTRSRISASILFRSPSLSSALFARRLTARQLSARPAPKTCSRLALSSAQRPTGPPSGPSPFGSARPRWPTPWPA